MNRANVATLSVACVVSIGSIDYSQFGAGVALNFSLKAIAALIPLTLFTLSYLLDRERVKFGRSTGPYLLAALLSLGGFSIIWSVDRTETFIAILSWGVTFASTYLLLGLSLRNAASALVIPIGVLCTLSLVYALISPGAFMFTDGVMRLRGVVYGPHGLAEPSVLCLCILCSGLLPWRRAVLVALFVVVSICLYLTYSRQSFIAAIGAIALVVLFRSRGGARAGFVYIATGALVFGLIALSLSNMDVLASISRGGGDDVGSLTGRTYIWAAAITLISQEPWLGYGFGAGGKVIEAGYSGGISGWTTQSAHNSMLQAGLDLGWIGIFFVAMLLIGFVRNAFRQDRQFSVPLMTAILVMSSVERGFYETGGFMPAVFLFILLRRRTHQASINGG
ncbi:O-antigen ligase family protein [Rhodanobacter sp. FDAARGOS 1247]|uniref:O-antigen ligase family protein n=1 Tax=Rhodanobacter sp. FDAARGOS 1247 TaxID=2778082 RepID=UPI0019513DC7|nr:O-antigen ligase family protein [Rhodanobacter sp. FDAARGOS 1247]QRP64506.1 O-antigen ligase family protein [Rhodanobacter sp. FDAARGOS 1247]